jgi:hypothetical protein
MEILHYQGGGLSLNGCPVSFQTGKYYSVPEPLYSFLKNSYPCVFISSNLPEGSVAIPIIFNSGKNALDHKETKQEKAPSSPPLSPEKQESKTPESTQKTAEPQKTGKNKRKVEKL